MRMVRWVVAFRKAVLLAFEHDMLNTAKAAAYSGMLMLFPTMVVVTALLALVPEGSSIMGQIRITFMNFVPADTYTLLLSSMQAKRLLSTQLIFSAAILSVFAGLGMMLSLMEGFRRAYRVPHGQWGFWKERVVALALVPGAMIPMAAATIFLAFGHTIEQWMIENTDLALHLYLVLVWRLIRWMIALLASILSLELVYHYAVPRQKLQARAGRFHLSRGRWRETLPGAAIATATWFITTLVYGWYLTHFSDYSVVYGSLGAGIATLVWLYMVSLIILIGAEFNAHMFPLPPAGELAPARSGEENVAVRSAAV